MAQKLAAIVVAVILSVPSFGQKRDTSRTYMEGIPKNSVYGELGGNALFGSISYERILALNEKTAFAPRAGLGFWEAPVVLIELDFLFGGKHSFEAGPGFSVLPAAEASVFTFRAGYRFMGRKGLLIRLAPLFWMGISDGEAHPMAHAGLSVGYSF